MILLEVPALLDEHQGEVYEYNECLNLPDELKPRNAQSATLVALGKHRLFVPVMEMFRTESESLTLLTSESII
jgi:hypothetical protein